VIKVNPEASGEDTLCGEADSIKEILDYVDDDRFLPQGTLELALWVAEYYACGPGDAVAAAMPPFAWTRKGTRVARTAAFKTERVVRLSDAGHQVAMGKESQPPGRRQREAIATLAGMASPVSRRVLAERGVTSDAVRGLVRRGLVLVEAQRVDRDPFRPTEDVSQKDLTGSGVSTLTAEQQAALQTLSVMAEQSEFRVALLHGVTGSGKTELYLRLAQVVSGRGQRVLVLVPEIVLAPAIARAFRAVFGDRVAIQHSGLSDGERHDQWQRIRRGDVDVVVGTRSAVFAPLEDLGLVVVDEEHDASYKQEESPRYHGRDAAIVRARYAGALVVLGSATPSMESYHNAMSGRYARLVMPQRVLERPLPSVQIVDMRAELASQGAEAVLSAALHAGIADRLERGEQSLVLLNRRGFAASVLCRQCGQTLECPNCTVALTFHQAARRVRCHYCNYSRARPKVCPQCAGPYLERIGFGTERIESEIVGTFPDARVARLDRDTVRRRGAAGQILARFGAREIDVLVGTQMIAKGHDFPAVTLVGVISAVVGLGMADFRASERTFQLLTQVAGRAGRGDTRGEAIIQTFHPDHYSISLACRQAYEPFFEAEMHFRRSMRYPPVVAMINAIVRAPRPGEAMRDANELAQALRAAGGRFEVLGPAPAPLARLRGAHRAQFFLKGTHRPAMREALQAVLADHPRLQRRVTVDVDPLTVL
jgi:primosomal protein N' (replication factor Y)